MSLVFVLHCLALCATVCFGQTRPPPCSSKIYCYGDLLHTVQTSRIFNDSKSFVDMRMKYVEQTIQKNFKVLMNSTNNSPTKAQVKTFVTDNFDEGNELENWTPPDFTAKPGFLQRVNDSAVKDFAQKLLGIWPTLGKKVKKEVFNNTERYSFITVPNGFIIPGGRFRELYYWDSYWIINGLLISDMKETAKNMIENFLSLVDRYGFVPNGARVYYLNRSQPPLLTAMALSYYKYSQDKQWLRNSIKLLDKELQYWLANKLTQVERAGINYTAAHYDSESSGPRPESYIEDVNTASYYPPEKREQVYVELKSGAESGWDFSSRWFFDAGGNNEANITFIEASRVVPVDLNAFLCGAFKQLSEFYLTLGDLSKATFWREKGLTWQKTVEKLFWDEEAGVWFDYDLKLSKARNYFYPSNLSPLWAGCFEKTQGKRLGKRVLNYLKSTKVLNYEGGTPASLAHTGEQWDFPNAWPPLQAILVQALYKSGNCEAMNASKELATKWIKANMIGFQQTGEMFEKYDAVEPGQYGGGGEYTVQAGFGWTNGVALEFINQYYTNNK